jgi:peptidoglycan/xylan/chitin deacetylase (PgdA/CDA1 family)
MPSFRLDRLVTLCFARTLGPVLKSTGEGRLPVLMYHSVSGDLDGTVSPYYRTVTSPDVFADQMELLRKAGYQALSLKDGLERFRGKNGGVNKSVVITFDDGFRDFHTHAFPVLRRHGFGATMFLPTAFIGNQSMEFKSRPCLTWGEARELQKGGIEFGSHTVNHPKLYELDFAQIRAELEQSKATMEHELGAPVAAFAYPYAFPSADRQFVRNFTGILKAVGYECAVTTRIGRVGDQDDLFTLKRLPVNSADDAALFSAKLDGAYDWLAWPQEIIKHGKKMFVAPNPARTSTQTAGAASN